MYAPLFFPDKTKKPYHSKTAAIWKLAYWLEQLDSKKGYIIEKQRIFNEYKSPIYGDFFILQKIFENVKNVKVKIIRGFFGDFGKRD